MKLLIISHNPVTDYNSMGKTMLSLFSEFHMDELIQFYIYPTIPNIQKCRSYYRVTDREVLKSIVTFQRAGKCIKDSKIQTQNLLYENEKDRQLYALKDRFQTFFLICRCIIWKLGHWKTKSLQKWMEEEKPDAIFAMPGQSAFFYSVISYFHKKWKLPICSYFCDDFYHADTVGKSLLKKCYQRWLDHKIKQLVLASKTIVTISDALKKCYDQEFGCLAITVTTGTNFSIVSEPVTNKSDVLAYFGSLELGRNRSLAKIGEALDRINNASHKNYRLHIHSDVLSPDRLVVFEGIRSIQIMPFIAGNQVFSYMQDCCVLIHTESFDSKYRDRIRYSLSTKIADSLASGVCLFAFGPNDIASMEYLSTNECAFVVTEENELDRALDRLLQSADIRKKMAMQGLMIARKNHDSVKQGMLVKKILEKTISMRILQVNCVYPKGSTGRLMEELSKRLKIDGQTSIICYGRGKRLKEEQVYKTASEFFSKARKVISIYTGMHYNKCLFPTIRLIHIIQKEQPNIVHLHCINGYFVNIYRLIWYLKKNQIPTVLTLHAEFMYTGNCPHADDCIQWVDGCHLCQKDYPAASKSFLRMKEAFEHFQNLSVVSVSSWLMERAKMSAILRSGAHLTIENGINTNVFYYRSNDEIHETIKANFAEKTVLHITPNFSDENKGGKFVICLAKLLPKTRFVIIGYNGKEKLPPNVTGIQYLQDQNELASYYSLADVTLLTSKRETFGLVVAESLCCGTPVVGFLSGGPETIAMKEYSSFSAYADILTMKENLKHWLEWKYDKKKVSEAAIAKYNGQYMYEQYLHLYQCILNKKES